MTFLIIVLMHAASISETSKLYMFTQPTFKELQGCKQFVGQFHNYIYKRAAEAYKFKLVPKEIYCIEKEAVPKLLKPKGEQV
jgi:hypothetical protein